MSMFPYTLLPDGHTLEPEDVVNPPATTQEESTSTQSPPPASTTPEPEPVTGPTGF